MTLPSVLRSVFVLARIAVSVVGAAVTIGYAVLFAFEFFHASNIEHASTFVLMKRTLTPSVIAVSRWFSWSWPRGNSPNFAPAILAVATMIVSAFLESIILRPDYTLRRMIKPKRRRPSTPAASGGVMGRYAGTVDTEQRRAALLQQFREIEESLRLVELKTCAFVSIDVVGSTKMKLGEQATPIAATFQAYDELVRRAFAGYGVWKSTWTPDGVMACFLDRELALRAAQHILNSLERFNAEENQLLTPFKIRCGMNEGDVAIFEDSALEKVSDHAIDIAGHMQKYAGEDELLISDVLYRKLKSPADFVPTGKEVDDFPTYAWTPQRSTV